MKRSNKPSQLEAVVDTQHADHGLLAPANRVGETMLPLLAIYDVLRGGG
jgi:hypothetical protein